MGWYNEAVFYHIYNGNIQLLTEYGKLIPGRSIFLPLFACKILIYMVTVDFYCC